MSSKAGIPFISWKVLLEEPQTALQTRYYYYYVGEKCYGSSSSSWHRSQTETVPVFLEAILYERPANSEMMMQAPVFGEN